MTASRETLAMFEHLDNYGCSNMAGLKIGLSVVLVIGLLGRPGSNLPLLQEASWDADAVDLFEHRVADYMALHARLERELPPLGPSPSIASILARRAELASAIVAARPHAGKGDIFGADVAGLFRRAIARGLEGVDTEALLADLYAEDAAPSSFHPRVHDRYPPWATREMPPVLLARLPSLPAGLRYQLIDHDLVLWDVEADLIVDVVHDAIVRRMEALSLRTADRFGVSPSSSREPTAGRVSSACSYL